MEKTKVNAILTMVLSVIVLIGIVLSHLALTDIYHGIEPNLETEWWMVRITFILVGFLVLSAIVLAGNILRAGEIQVSG